MTFASRAWARLAADRRRPRLRSARWYRAMALRFFDLAFERAEANDAAGQVAAWTQARRCAQASRAYIVDERHLWPDVGRSDQFETFA